MRPAATMSIATVRPQHAITAVCGLMLFSCVARICSAQELTLKPFKADGIYALGEKAGWTATLPAGSASAVADYSYIIRKNNLDVIKSGSLDLSRPATIEVTLDEPAMLYAVVK